MDDLLPYRDGTWWVNEHQISARFPLVCRGNCGEVYPNVVSPITGSIVSVPFAAGQTRLGLEAGMVSPRQLAEFDGRRSAFAPMFAGYLYANVSLARSAVLRTPGLTVEMVDRQMFGLTGAPGHRRGPGDLSVRVGLAHDPVHARPAAAPRCRPSRDDPRLRGRDPRACSRPRRRQ